MQAYAITQQTKSPVNRIHATNQDQALSDSAADSPSAASASEPASNGSGNGHLSPQDAFESNGFVVFLPFPHVQCCNC